MERRRKQGILYTPKRPPSSLPLPEHFDAPSQELTMTPGPETDIGTRAHASWGPMDEGYLPSMTHPVAGPSFHGYQMNGSRSETLLPLLHDRPGETEYRDMDDVSERRYGLDPTGFVGLEGAEEYKEYSLYVKEMDRLFGSGKPVDIQAELPSHPQANGGCCSGEPSGKDSGGWKKAVSSTPGRHYYDLVNDRVLEESLERTVTIATWRERVAVETADAHMSVYYVHPNEHDPQSIPKRPRPARRPPPPQQRELPKKKRKDKPRLERQDHCENERMRAGTPWPRKDMVRSCTLSLSKCNLCFPGSRIISKSTRRTETPLQVIILLQRCSTTFEGIPRHTQRYFSAPRRSVSDALETEKSRACPLKTS